nr:hypothetical protein [Tanacetum cinerariifolium]
PGQLEERLEHLRGAAAGLFREAQPAPRRPGTAAMGPDRADQPDRERASGPGQRLVSAPDRFLAVRAGTPPQGRLDRRAIQAEPRLL